MFVDILCKNMILKYTDLLYVLWKYNVSYKLKQKSYKAIILTTFSEIILNPINLTIQVLSYLCVGIYVCACANAYI